MFLTFPLMVIKINPETHSILWEWKNMLWVGIGTFCISLLVRFYQARNKKKSLSKKLFFADRKIPTSVIVAFLFFSIIFPFLFSNYHVNIMTTALMYIVLGLGLNIIVGLAGLLNLGYAAFYAIGAYSYALLNYHFGIGFWLAIPIAALLSALAGILLGFPVLRLRGDYLAIVTLCFGTIIRLILENWDELTFGPSGISQIPRPTFFGIEFSPHNVTTYIYFIALGFVFFTIFMVNRLKHSKIGREWQALREDEIACEAMGVDKTKTKLSAFALGATWAGMMGVLFAAKTTFINPASFTFIESVIMLSIVVLGGMGSISGIIIAALILILLPEYLRELGNYRMIVFGLSMVVIIIFKPHGLIGNVKKNYKTDYDVSQ